MPAPNGTMKSSGSKFSHHIDEAGWSELRQKPTVLPWAWASRPNRHPGNAVPVFGSRTSSLHGKDLETAGVKFDGETLVVEGMVSTATFYDPDGNALMLAQDLTGDC